MLLNVLKEMKTRIYAAPAVEGLKYIYNLALYKIYMSTVYKLMFLHVQA